MAAVVGAGLQRTRPQPIVRQAVGADDDEMVELATQSLQLGQVSKFQVHYHDVGAALGNRR